jgi:RNA polymerase sigma-70 factor (ECF subfamily)
MPTDPSDAPHGGAQSATQAERRGELTRLLEARAAGDGEAGQALLSLVYDDLRNLAARHLSRERPDHTLQPTALLHEAWMRLEGREGLAFPTRAHYLALASQVMRALLVDHARRKNSKKRGGEFERITLSEQMTTDTPDALDLIALDDALEELAALDAGLARLVELRFFGGLTVEETAELLELSKRAVERRYSTASAWLRRALE